MPDTIHTAYRHPEGSIQVGSGESERSLTDTLRAPVHPLFRTAA